MIKIYLDENGLKQAFIAEKMGVPANQFCTMLNGRRKITGEEFIKICDVLDVDTAYFVEKLKAAENEAQKEIS